MKAIITGLMTLFNAGSDFYNAISGRLFFGEAPEGVEYPYAVFFIISDVDEDVFAKNGKEVYIQFSLFSGASSTAEILDMDTYLTALFKDISFAVLGWTVINMKRVSGSGPNYNAADVEAGTGFYWQTDTDYIISVEKT